MKARPITSWDDVPIVMDLVMAGRIVGLTPDRLSILSRRGEFPATKIGKEWRVEKDELLAYMRSRRNAYQQPGPILRIAKG